MGLTLGDADAVPMTEVDTVPEVVRDDDGDGDCAPETLAEGDNDEARDGEALVLDDRVGRRLTLGDDVPVLEALR